MVFVFIAALPIVFHRREKTRSVQKSDDHNHKVSQTTYGEWRSKGAYSMLHRLIILDVMCLMRVFAVCGDLIRLFKKVWKIKKGDTPPPPAAQVCDTVFIIY